MRASAPLGREEGITNPLFTITQCNPGQTELPPRGLPARATERERADAATFPPYNSGGGEPPRHGRADADGAGHLSEGRTETKHSTPAWAPRAERAARGAAKPKPTGRRPGNDHNQARRRGRRAARPLFVHKRELPGQKENGGIIPRPRCTATSPERSNRLRTRRMPGLYPSATSSAHLHRAQHSGSAGTG